MDLIPVSQIDRIQQGFPFAQPYVKNVLADQLVITWVKYLLLYVFILFAALDSIGSRSALFTSCVVSSGIIGKLLSQRDVCLGIMLTRLCSYGYTD
jgi:hypothetical protein